MTENIDNNNETSKIDDAELDEVVGGRGDWNPWNETAYKRRWAYDNPDISFENWIKTRLGSDSIKAREAWLADGSPQNLSYHYDNGKMWTEFYQE